MKLAGPVAKDLADWMNAPPHERWYYGERR